MRDPLIEVCAAINIPKLRYILVEVYVLIYLIYGIHWPHCISLVRYMDPFNFIFYRFGTYILILVGQKM